jgi:UPF0755 protein
MRRLLAVALGFALLLAAGGGAGAIWIEREVDAPGKKSGDLVTLTVPKGATGRQIGELLLREELIQSHVAWRYHLWRRGSFKATAGRHQVDPKASIRGLATALEGVPLPEDEPFVVVEGWRLRDTDAALAQAGYIQPGAYVKEAQRPKGFTAPFPLPPDSLEGYLYPETYRVPRQGLQVHALLQRQLDTFAERVYRPRAVDITQGHRSLHELVKMASMLEREEPTPAQRPLIAGILWKRIDRHIPLGVDATSRYQLAEWNDRKAFLKALRDESDPYNSRHNPGLPPTPLGAPSESSFDAALRPQASEYLYYLHDADKKLHASRNAQEHEALRERYGVH